DLGFPQLRNAMLVLLQHNLCTATPAVEYLQVYHIEIDEIFARLRFPHFLEHVGCRYGDKAQELLLVALKYGRVTRQLLLAEAAEALELEDTKELQDLLEVIVKDRILRPEAELRVDEAKKRKRDEEEICRLAVWRARLYTDTTA
ncbi:unnamed protein product, partial [Effrenium voratum]